MYPAIIRQVCVIISLCLFSFFATMAMAQETNRPVRISRSVQAQEVPQPRVVVSIRPLHSLVSGIMEGVGQPTLLFAESESPHVTRITPSQANILRTATIFFWMGPSLEPFLMKYINNLPEETRIVQMDESPGLFLLPALSDHIHGDVNDGENEHNQAEERIDPHIWLSPENARQMIRFITTVLKAHDMPHAAQYEANFQRLDQKLQRLQKYTRSFLSSVTNKRFAVYHDAYRYFEKSFDLLPSIPVTLNPQIPPGPRRLAALKAELLEENIKCLFVEPQFSSKFVTLLEKETGVRVGTLDPIGTSIETEGPKLYFQLITTLADSLRQCLANVEEGIFQ